MTQQRRILWNREYNFQGENVTRWYFLIVNAQREITGIRKKIYEGLAPVDNIEDLDKSRVKSTEGLYYDLFRLESPKPRFNNPLGIYNGKWKRERSLYTRETDLSLLNILEREGLA
nr:hypothetical protein [Nanoarchaeum sp.]